MIRENVAAGAAAAQLRGEQAGEKGGRHTGWKTVPEVEEEEPERRGPSLKSIFELKIGFSSEAH